MPFVPHTNEEIKQMLDTIGVSSIEQLFDEIPAELRNASLEQVPAGCSEMEVARDLRDLARRDGQYLNFIGGGVYEHHIPAAVWELTTRGEFYTAYTPYQAEASQGTLQLLYEYQTMIASLTGLDVANASLYEGASALAEAVLAAVRSQKNARSILMPRSINPVYRKVVHSIVKNQNIDLIEVDFSHSAGRITDAELADVSSSGLAAVVIAQPNFFGVLEEVDRLTDWAHERGALVIGCGGFRSR